MLTRIRRLLHAILGVPDYDRYLCHMTRHHPDHPALTRDEFAVQRMNDRYSRPGARCC